MCPHTKKTLRFQCARWRNVCTAICVSAYEGKTWGSRGWGPNGFGVSVAAEGDHFVAHVLLSAFCVSICTFVLVKQVRRPPCGARAPVGLLRQYLYFCTSHPRTAEASGIFTTTGRFLFYNNCKENCRCIVPNFMND
jgi:hypothetical protein